MDEDQIDAQLRADGLDPESDAATTVARAIAPAWRRPSERRLAADVRFEDIPAGFGGGAPVPVQAPSAGLAAREVPPEWLQPSERLPQIDTSIAHSTTPDASRAVIPPAVAPAPAPSAPMAAAARELVAADPSPRPSALPTYDPGQPGAPVARARDSLVDLVGSDVTSFAPDRRAGERGSGPQRGTIEAPREMTGEEFVAALAETPPDAFREAFPEDYAGTSLYDREREQIADATRIAQRSVELEAVEAAEHEENLRRIESERIARQREHDAAINQATNRYRAALDVVAQQRVDPARWFHDRGFAGTVGAAIAMAVGEFAAQMTGGTNAAAQIIQGAIRDDLEAQQINLAHMRDSAESQRGLLGLMQQQFGDRETAAQAAEALQLQQAAQRARQRAAELGSAEAREQGETLALALDQRAAEAQAAARTALVDRQLEVAEQAARIRRLNAQAARDERRAMGGGGGGAGAGAGRAPTGEVMSAVNRALDAYEASGGTDLDAHRERVAQIYRVPIDIMPPVGGRFPESSTGEARQRMDAVDTALRELEDVLPADGEDIPGIGTIDSIMSEIPLLGRAWAGDQGQLIRQRSIGAVRRFLRIESGGAITDDEVNEELVARGLTAGASESTFREGIRQLRADVDARQGRFGRIGSRRARADRQIEAAGARRVE